MKKLRKFGRPMEEVRPLSLRQCNQVNVASPRADDNRRGKGLMVRIFFFSITVRHTGISSERIGAPQNARGSRLITTRFGRERNAFTSTRINPN